MDKLIIVLILIVVSELSSAEIIPKISISIESLEISFIKIPAGSILLGDINGQKDERPRVKVQLSSFYFQEAEVTRTLFKKFVDATPSFQSADCWVYRKKWVKSSNASWRDPGYTQTEEHPVVCVSWENVQKFIKWLNKKSSYQFRLPSEAEWEYAVRAGSEHRYYWGKDPVGLCRHANASDAQTLKRFPTFKSNTCDDGFLETAPAKSFLPNPHGLYDVYGNVWEWTQDCWNTHYQHMPKNGLPVLSGDCERRVFRGGGWGDNPNFARSGLRNRGHYDRGKDDVGFRLVLESGL